MHSSRATTCSTAVRRRLPDYVLRRLSVGPDPQTQMALSVPNATASLHGRGRAARRPTQPERWQAPRHLRAFADRSAVRALPCVSRGLNELSGERVECCGKDLPVALSATDGASHPRRVRGPRARCSQPESRSSGREEDLSIPIERATEYEIGEIFTVTEDLDSAAWALRPLRAKRATSPQPSPEPSAKTTSAGSKPVSASTHPSPAPSPSRRPRRAQPAAHALKSGRELLAAAPETQGQDPVRSAAARRAARMRAPTRWYPRWREASRMTCSRVRKSVSL